MYGGTDDLRHVMIVGTGIGRTGFSGATVTTIIVDDYLCPPTTAIVGGYWDGGSFLEYEVEKDPFHDAMYKTANNLAALPIQKWQGAGKRKMPRR